MQAVGDPHLVKRIPVNWHAGLQALTAAFCLISTGAVYHSSVSIGGGVVIAGYAVFVPLRVPNQIASLPIKRFALQLIVRAVPILGAIYLAGLAVNSGLPVIDTVGNAVFIGLLALSGAIVLRVGTRNTLKSFRLVAVNSTSAIALVRAQIDLILHSFSLRRSS
jgi:hypothetical protein